jgi:hypothetical protein
MYWISRLGQSIMGSAVVWGLCGGLTAPHCKKKEFITKCYTGTRSWWSLLNTVMNLRFV